MENYSYNTAAAAAAATYPESGDSSPRSREIDFENPPPWEDQQQIQIPSNYKVKFMCSYGGKIHPRPHDNLLSYIGGETKILSVDRNIRFSSLLSKLVSLCDGDSVSFKYQLPGEDLDALISVTNDDDLEHMMHEYDRLYRVSPKPARLRIFVFLNGLSHNPSLNSSNRSFGSEEGKSRFVEALNSAPIVTAPPEAAAPAASMAAMAAPPLQNNVDFLFGLEKANAVVPPVPVVVGRAPVVVEDPVVVPDPVLDPIQKHIQDLNRLRLEEQQQQQQQGTTSHLRKNNDYEYYKEPERSSPVAVQGGVQYWTDKQVPSGVFSANNMNNEQPIYMMPPQASAYHAPPMMRQVTGAPGQGYYTMQRIPSDHMYREQQQQQQQQQQQMYNVIPQSAVPSVAAAAPPSLPPQKVTGYTEGFGMVRPVVTDSGYAHMAYDGGMGRQVIYSAPGGVMGTPASAYTAAAHYQAMGGAGGADMRQGGAMNLEGGGKVIGRPTQT